MPRPRDEFLVHTTSRDGTIVLRLHGELDMATTPLLREALSRADGHRPHAVVVDLRDLSFIDGAGVHALVEAYERAQAAGGSVKLINLGPWTRRVFQLTGRTHLIAESSAGTGGPGRPSTPGARRDA